MKTKMRFCCFAAAGHLETAVYHTAVAPNPPPSLSLFPSPRHWLSYPRHRARRPGRQPAARGRQEKRGGEALSVDRAVDADADAAPRMLTRRENLLTRPWQQRRFHQHRKKVRNRGGRREMRRFHIRHRFEQPYISSRWVETQWSGLKKCCDKNVLQALSVQISKI